MKGFSRESFILYYAVFIFFVVYVSGLAGMNILSNTSGIENLPKIDLSDVFSVIVVPLQYFLILLSLSSVYAMIFTLIILPFTVVLIWIILSWLRGI